MLNSKFIVCRCIILISLPNVHFDAVGPSPHFKIFRIIISYFVMGYTFSKKNIRNVQEAPGGFRKHQNKIENKHFFIIYMRKWEIIWSNFKESNQIFLLIRFVNKTIRTRLSFEVHHDQYNYLFYSHKVTKNVRNCF